MAAEEKVQITEKDSMILKLEEELRLMKERMEKMNAPPKVKCRAESWVTQESKKGEEAVQKEKAKEAKGVRNLREFWNKSMSSSSVGSADAERAAREERQRKLTKSEVQAKLQRLVARGGSDLDEVRRLRKEVELLQSDEPPPPTRTLSSRTHLRNSLPSGVGAGLVSTTAADDADEDFSGSFSGSFIT